jgi:serine/threonine protein kinase
VNTNSMAIPDPDFLAVQQALAGQYSLERELGRGGMGIVYLAREVSLDRLVAVKVLPPALGERPGLRERFLREARTAAKLSHPHIVPIFRVGEAGPFVYFAMAYVDGETLGQRLRARGPLVPTEAARILREAAWALAYAHAQGVVHRDVKPDNILLERGTGRTLLTDFGIAHVAEATSLTDESLVMGTAHFMSPEQGTGEALDGRSDLYGLGVVGYLMLTGRLPFDAPTVPAVLAKHLTQTPPPLAGGGSPVPAALARVVERCLAKAPEARWATGEALAEALAQATEARRDLPAPLRVWLQKRDPMRPLYFVWSGMISVSSVAGIVAHLNNPVRFNFDGVPWWAFGLLMAGVAALPLLPAALFRLNLTRRTLAAGYTLDDLRLALRDDVARRREEMALEMAERDGLGVRLYQLLTYGTVAWTAAVIFAGDAIGIPTALRDDVLQASILGSILLTVVGSALGVTFPGRGIRSGKLLGWRLRFWEGRAGRWTARVARLFSRSRVEPGQLVHRPTELAIGLAAEQLFQALPKATRARLGDLPGVVHQLEAHATTMRARVAGLDQLLASARTPERPSASLAASGAAADGLETRRDAVAGELQAARDQAAERLAATVAALETIRLDLLRLQGGTGDVGRLTTMLEEARRLDDDVRRLVAAHDATQTTLDGRRELPSPA